MRYIAWNLAVAAWMLISAFVFPHTAQSAALTWVTAIVLGVLAVASRAKPGLRLLTATVALVLGSSSLFLEGMSGTARISNALATAIVFALASIPGRAGAKEGGAGSAAPPA